MPTSDVAPLSWSFLVRFFSASESSVILSSSVWEKSTFGREVYLIFPSETQCIVFSSLICPTRFGVLDDPEGRFSADSKYSESPSINPKLDTKMMSLSGFAGGLGDSILPSVVCAQFRFIFPLPTAAGVAVLRVAVSVCACVR